MEPQQPPPVHFPPHSRGDHPRRHRRRRMLFWRMFGSLAAIAFLLLLALVIILVVTVPPLREAIPLPWVTVLGFFVIFAVPLLLIAFAGVTFRQVGRPFGELMNAIDALADGELDVRVRGHYGGEFGRLARSFNRMAEELERAEQQRRNLTADVAHELRTPIAVIQGNLEGVLDGVYQPTTGHIEATLEETRLLTRLVDDLQTLSLAEAGQLPLHRRDVTVSELLEDVRASFNGQAAAAGVGFRVPAEGSAGEALVHGDADRLGQALGNLVSNALRYTSAGGAVALAARLAGEGVEISVRDTGLGIAAEDLPYVFDRFWRGDPARTRQAGAGSGLGLAITRQIVEAHGGSIRVESEPGTGAEFIIWIPLASQ